MTPALVFIIPAFNAAPTVAQTIASALAQTRPGVSILVINDGSTDDTASILARAAAADPRVRIVHQENRGLAEARNRGVAELLAGMYTGPVCFLDADDAVDPRYAQVMLEALGDADAVACACRMVGPALQDVGWTIRPGDHDLTPARLIEFNPLAVGAVTFRLDAAARLGLLRRDGGRVRPFDPSLPVHEDWDCWLRFTAAGGRWAPVIPEALFRYRMLPGSMSGALERMYRVGLRVIDSAAVPAELKPGARRRWALRHIARAAARGDAILTSRFVAEVPAPISEADLETIAGSLRWALCQEHQTGPALVTPGQERAWHERIRALLPGLSPETLIERLRFGQGHWSQVADAFLACIGRTDTGVIYGLGRNGRDVLAAIEQRLDSALSESVEACDHRPALPRLAWIDDNPAAEAPILLGRPLPRLRPEALRARHIVLVTPERRADILGELSARGLPNIHTPETIAGLAAGY
jgi:glycosyltransferase involved in cell wall biosynthesis